MALFNFGKKKEEEKKTPACACSCGGAASEAESITNDCCPDLKEGEICCIKVLGSGCCHALYENTQSAVNAILSQMRLWFQTSTPRAKENPNGVFCHRFPRIYTYFVPLRTDM